MVTRALARFVAEKEIQDIPREVLSRSRDALIDTLGVALAGSREPVGDIVARWIDEVGARSQASVLRGGLRTSPAEAAFANGIFAHVLDFDDSLPSLRGHPSAPMIPAALAVGEVVGASGLEVLAAYALGLEVAGKLGRALGHGHYLRGWHTTATIGALSATAVAARLWKLDAEALCTAWGIAASQVAGLVRNFGTMTKPFHAGHAARSGVVAAWMARHGFTADRAIFDGEKSIFATYGTGDGVPLSDLVGQLGETWEMLTPGIFVKRWPCCYCNHRPVGGLLELLERHDIGTEEIEEISVGFLPGADTALVSRMPRTGLEAKFSIEYAAAAAVLDRKLTLDSFTDGMVQRPRVRELMTRVRRYRIPDSGVYSGVVGYSDVAVVTARGSFEVRVDRVPGSPDWPMTPAERNEKFIDCASRALGVEGARRLLQTAQHCDALTDIRELLEAATTPRAGDGGVPPSGAR